MQANYVDISMLHLMREFNKTTDSFSKDVLLLENGSLQIQFFFKEFASKMSSYQSSNSFNML